MDTDHRPLDRLTIGDGDADLDAGLSESDLATSGVHVRSEFTVNSRLAA